MSTNIKIKAMSDNGINAGALREFTDQVAIKPAAGIATFGVATVWKGGTRTRAQTMPLVLGDKTLARDFAIDADEPAELLGTNTAANPQELILAALNACMAATYAANAAAMDIELKSLTIRTKGSLDLRGFLGIDPAINPGYDCVEYEVEIASAQDSQAIEALHARVQQTSPNYHNFARAIDMKAKLIILP
ncbi:MAG: OsmC family protein [Ottowia sp.]|nr:OsmC family protein [Ottowia sp.]